MSKYFIIYLYFENNRKLKKDGTFKRISASNIRVGDIIILNQNERVPADMVLLYTTEKNGSIFLRTD